MTQPRPLSARRLGLATLPVAVALIASAGCGGSSLKSYADAREAERNAALDPAPAVERDEVALASPASVVASQPVDPAFSGNINGEVIDAARAVEAYAADVEAALEAARQADTSAEPAPEFIGGADEFTTAEPADSDVSWSAPEAAPAAELPAAEIREPATDFVEPGRVTQAPTPEPEPVARTAAAAVPVAPTTLVPKASLTQIDRELQARLEADPTDTAAHLDRQVLAYLRPGEQPDPGQIAELPVEDRELVSSVVDGLTELRAVLASRRDARRSEKVAPVVGMAERLSRGGSLALSGVQLCSRVDGFGEYEPMDATFPARLPPGRQAHAVLYAEVEDFTSQLNAEGRWETRLIEQCTLYSESGLQVWASEPAPVVDRARRRRSDFFVSKRLRLPDTLAPGTYTLKFTLTDDFAKRITEASIPVRIAPQE